jgi:hypothetical protein
MPPRRLAAAALSLLACFLVGAQEAPSQSGGAAPGGAAPGGAEAAPASPDDTRSHALLIELSTAGFYELASRARELGLPDSGGAEDIRARLYEHYGLKAPPAASAKVRTVTIERAGEASYEKVEGEEGGIVRMSGGVILSLVETNGDTHRITADSIAYNRASGTVTARGSVTYERKSGSTTELFTGEALSADLTDWSGVFIDGKVRRAGEGSGAGERGLVITADTILRRSADVMVLKDGVISSCDADDPHYAVRASKVWILGDKEWAVQNAVFSLGNVPILWLPFMYYPGDELFFHPVLGFRSREGRFFQTTSYLIGAKPPAKGGTSILSFNQTGPAKPTQLKGLFLHAVSGPPPKDEGSLKVMADIYSNLGAFAGVQGSFPKLGFLDKTDFLAGLGVSRSVFPPLTDPDQNFYSPFVSAGGYASLWNGSDFLGLSLPLARYALDFSSSLKAGSFSATVALPIYSDPYFDTDFRNRTEDMDWLKLLSAGDTGSATTVSSRTQLLPRLDLSYSLKPKSLDPWISSITLNKLSVNLDMEKKADTKVDGGPANAALYSADPRRDFFYPSIFHPFELSASLGGSLPGDSAAAGTPAAAARPGSAQVPGPGQSPGGAELRDPWSDSAKEEPAAASDKAPVAGVEFRLPPRAPSAAAGQAAGWTGSASWSLAPAVALEDSFNSDGWTSPADIDYSLRYQLWSYRLNGSLSAKAGYGDALTATLGLSYADQDQVRPIVNADPGVAASYAATDAKSKSRILGDSAKLSFTPFASSWLWSGTRLEWGMDSTIYGLRYDSASSAIKERWLSWDPAVITSHNVSLILAAKPAGLVQSLSLSASLPPLLDSYRGSLALDAGLAALTLQARMYRKSAGGSYGYDPVSASLSLGKAPGPSLSDSLVYDGTGPGLVSSSTTFSWRAFNASLTARQTASYSINSTTHLWVPSAGQSFAPADFAMNFNPTWSSGGGAAPGGTAPAGTPASGAAAAAAPGAALPQGAVWSLGAKIALKQNLLQFSSDSSLRVELSASLKVSDKLSLTLSSQSQNSSLWRYYADLFAPQLEGGGFSVAASRVNPLEDLWNSIKVWDSAALRKGLFKLKGLSFDAAIDLHDWTLTANVSTKPLYDTTNRTYTLDTSFSVLLAWKDIQAIKTTVKKDSTGLGY